MEITQSLNDYSAPDAAGFVYREVVRPLQLRPATQNADEYPALFDPLRRKAEPKMQTGGAFPGTSAQAVHATCFPLPGCEIAGAGQRAGKFGNFCCGPKDASPFGPRGGAAGGGKTKKEKRRKWAGGRKRKAKRREGAAKPLMVLTAKRA